MQSSLRLLTATILSITLLAGCGRKKNEPIAAEPNAGELSDGGADRPSIADGGAKDGQTAVSVPGDSPAGESGVSAALATSDQVYEAWFRKYKLDLNDPKMLDADPDGDGVSNRDEFMADTNPGDPKSLPATAAQAGEAHAGLKLKQYTEVKLPIVLTAVDGETARIKRMDGSEKEESVRAGQTIAGLNLKVEKVQARRITDKHGSTVDASRVTVADIGTQEKTTLVKDMPARSSSSHAVLTSEDGQTSITVRQGDTFSWPKDGGTTFTVIDLRENQAVLQEEGTGKMWTVMK